jgi:hypothetical protein
MASTTFTILTTAITGVAITAKTAVASSESITIAPSTAQGSIDFATLQVRISAVGGSVTPTIIAGTGWSSIGQGNKAMTVIASSGSVILGGQDFESARFLNSSDQLTITMAGTGTASIEAYQAPKANE